MEGGLKESEESPCTPTSLFFLSLFVSLQPQNTDSDADAPIAKTPPALQQRATQPKNKERKLFIPQQHTWTTPVLVSLILWQSLQRGALLFLLLKHKVTYF